MAEGLSPQNPLSVHGLSHRDNSSWVLGLVDGSNCTAYVAVDWYLYSANPLNVTYLVDGASVAVLQVDGLLVHQVNLTVGSHFIQFITGDYLAFTSTIRIINTDVETDVIGNLDDPGLTVRLTETQYENDLMEAGLKAIAVFVLPLPFIAIVVQKRLDSRSKKVV